MRQLFLSLVLAVSASAQTRFSGPNEAAPLPGAALEQSVSIEAPNGAELDTAGATLLATEWLSDPLIAADVKARTETTLGRRKGATLARPQAAWIVSLVKARPALLADSKLRAAFVAAAGEDATRALERNEAPAPKRAIEKVAASWKKGAPSVDAAGAEFKSRAPRGRAAFRIAAGAAAMIAVAVVATPAPSFAQNAERPGVVQQQQASVGHFSSVQELISNSNADTPLYVNGDIGLDKASQRALAQYLAGKHWTVVVLQNSRGQVYKDRDGNSRSGDDAVEYAVGQGLMARDWFASQKHGKTGQADGKVLYISLDEHVLIYYGSDAEETRGLGEKDFPSPDRSNPTKLDRWAIAKMRSSGDLRGAIEATVENIDAALESAITNEIASSKASVASAASDVTALETAQNEFNKTNPGHPGNLGRTDVAGLRAKADASKRALEAGQNGKAVELASQASGPARAAIEAMRGHQRAVADAGSKIDLAEQKLKSLESGSAALRKEFPKVKGPLANPDVASMRESLGLARADLKAGRAVAAMNAATVIETQATSLASAIAAYPAGGKAIDAARTALAKQSARERAGESAATLRDAKRAIDEANQLYEIGDPGYASKLETARSMTASAGAAIDSADSSAAAWRLFWILLSAFLTAGLSLTAFLMNRRTRAPKADAEKQLQLWKVALDAKLSAAMDGLEDQVKLVIGPAEGDKKRDFTGTTKKMAAQSRKDVGELVIFWSSANSVHQKAEALIRGKGLRKVYNWLFPDNFKKGLKLLKDEPVEFDPEDGLPMVMGQERTWEGDLLGDLKTFEKFKMTFEEIIAGFQERAARAKASLDDIENALFNGVEVLDKSDKAIEAVADKKAGVEGAATDGLFKLASLFGVLLTSASAAVARARKLHEKDPVGAMRGSGADAGRKTAEAKALSDMILTARAGDLAATAAAEGELTKGRIVTKWVRTALEKLSTEADELAVQSAGEGAGEGIAALKASIEALRVKVQKAATLDGVRRDAVLPNITKATDTVAKARETLAPLVGIDADKLLREKDPVSTDADERDVDPSDRIAQASEAAEAAEKALGKGSVDAAEEALHEAELRTNEANAIVEATLAAQKAQETTVENRRAETLRLETAAPDAEKALSRIEKKFAKSVLKLAAGDPTHPSANGTVGDNIEEATTHTAAAKTKTEKAVKVFGEGKLLLAAELLRQAAAHQEQAEHRLKEVHEKEARLAATIDANRAQLATLDKTVAGYERTVRGERKTTQPTIKAFDEAKAALEDARKSFDADKGDPFATEAEIAAVGGLLQQVWTMTRNDADQYAEAENSVAAAKRQIDAARDQSRKADGDQIADSREIDQAQAALLALEKDLDKAARQLAEDHGNWRALDKEADRITAEAGRVAAEIKSELAEAEAAVSAISNAGSAVRKATNWSGEYGVYIPGSPGSGSLESARQALARGEYEEAERHASSARSTALAAIRRAESEVEEKRAAERRRQEAERRRREQEEEDRRRRSSGGSSGGFGGGSSGGGGSSWGSSGSGGGRSGW